MTHREETTVLGVRREARAIATGDVQAAEEATDGDAFFLATGRLAITDATEGLEAWRESAQREALTRREACMFCLLERKKKKERRKEGGRRRKGKEWSKSAADRRDLTLFFSDSRRAKRERL